MNPNVIIKLEEYQSFIEKSKELEELKRNIDISELNKYLESNPTVNFELFVRSSHKDSDFVTLDYSITKYNYNDPFPYDLVYLFIMTFNKKLYDKYEEIEKREKDLNYNAEKYIKSLSLIDKLKLFK